MPISKCNNVLPEVDKEDVMQTRFISKANRFYNKTNIAIPKTRLNPKTKATFKANLYTVFAFYLIRPSI